MDMRRSYMTLDAVSALAMTACGGRAVRVSGGDVDMGSSAATGSTPTGWGATLRGRDGWSGMRGSVFARPVESGTQVALTIEGGFAGSRYSWDVREGTCATPGPVVGDAAAYPMVLLGNRGMGSQIADLTVRLDASRQYVATLHGAGTEGEPPIACAALTR